MIETHVVNTNSQPYIATIPGKGYLSCEQDAIELIVRCQENGTDRLMLFAGNLTEDFYHLWTGLAGAALQKFVLYGIWVAFVIPAVMIGQGRFYEMVLEANRGSQIRFCHERGKAEQWLMGRAAQE